MACDDSDVMGSDADNETASHALAAAPSCADSELTEVTEAMHPQKPQKSQKRKRAPRNPRDNSVINEHLSSNHACYCHPLGEKLKASPWRQMAAGSDEAAFEWARRLRGGGGNGVPPCPFQNVALAHGSKPPSLVVAGVVGIRDREAYLTSGLRGFVAYVGSAERFTHAKNCWQLKNIRKAATMLQKRDSHFGFWHSRRRTLGHHASVTRFAPT